MPDEEDSEEPDPIFARLEEIDAVLQSLQRSRLRLYSDLQKANSGVLVSIGSDGEPDCAYGLLRKEDERAWSAPEQTPEHAGEEGSVRPSMTPHAAPEKEQKNTGAYSAALIESLTIHKTAALAAQLTQQPPIALALVVYTCALQEFGLELRSYGAASSLEWSRRSPSLAAAAGSPAYLFLEEQRQLWLAQLPTESDRLWRWCLEQEQATLLRLLAFCASRSLNSIQSKSDQDDAARLRHANALGLALGIDLAKWLTPTADNFFSKISKSQIVRALAEAGTPLMVDSAQLKKADLAARAEKMIQKTGWLPEPLRITPVIESPTDQRLTTHSDASETEQPTNQAA